MKTGFNLVVDPSKDADEFVEQSSSLFLVLLEEAMRSAATYAKATDRDVVTSEDVLYGLQYQAHQFSNIPNVHVRAT
jgi:histone H3/H4